MKAGTYDTVATCEDDDKMSEQNLPSIYKQKVTIGDCSVFWDREKSLRYYSISPSFFRVSDGSGAS